SKIPPATLVAGWYDIFCREQIDDYVALRAAGRDARLTIGPWHHGSPGGASRMLAETLQWADVHVAKTARAMNDNQRVQVFVMGAKRWASFPEWPVAATSERWHLQPDGGLAREIAPSSEPDAYRYDPSDPTPVEGGRSLFGDHAGAKEQRATEARDD